jgi:hypothetical protein
MTRTGQKIPRSELYVIACVFVGAVKCLSSRCLEMYISFGCILWFLDIGVGQVHREQDDIVYSLLLLCNQKSRLKVMKWGKANSYNN